MEDFREILSEFAESKSHVHADEAVFATLDILKDAELEFEDEYRFRNAIKKINGCMICARTFESFKHRNHTEIEPELEVVYM